MRTPYLDALRRVLVIPYYLDCVYKNHDNLKDYEKQIKDEAMKLGEDTTLLEYLRIYIFKYLSINTDNTKYLLNTYLNLKRGEGIYLLCDRGRQQREYKESYRRRCNFDGGQYSHHRAC